MSKYEHRRAHDVGHDAPDGEEPEHADESERGDESQYRSEPEREIEIYGRGVRTALRNNATAYGFSISITAAYGLVNGIKGSASALGTMSFAAGAAIGFVLIGVTFVARFRLGSLPESGQVLTISGGIDLISVVAAVATAYGLSRVVGYAAWPLTGFGTVIAYLLVGGLDVVIARAAARHTSFGRSQ